MSATATVTVLRSREELERLWHDPTHCPAFINEADATVRFAEAPGDRGTEIHVELAETGGKLGGIIQKLTGGDARAKVMDELRRFKQLVETGVIARSDSTPEGELAERKLKQRPAQALDESELEKANV